MYVFTVVFFFLFFKQKTAYEMRISDWSSDVCSSDLMLGVPLGRVDVRLGDSRFPVSAGSGGQWGANSSTAGVYAACAKLRALVADKLGLDPASVVFENGKVRAGGKSVTLAKAAADRSEESRVGKE